MNTTVNFLKKYWAAFALAFIIWSYTDIKVYQIKVKQDNGLVFNMRLTEPRWMYWIHFRTCDFVPPRFLNNKEYFNIGIRSISISTAGIIEGIKTLLAMLTRICCSSLNVVF